MSLRKVNRTPHSLSTPDKSTVMTADAAKLRDVSNSTLQQGGEINFS